MLFVFNQLNSFAHAEYGTSTQHEIDIHPGRVVIYNPGEFPKKFSPEDFATKNLSSIIRNELIAKVLYLCHDIESFGSGFERVYTLCKEGNIACSYKKTPIGFSFIFLRNVPKDTRNVPKNTQNVPKDAQNVPHLSETEKAVFELLKVQPNLTREELSHEVLKTVKTVQRSLDGLKKKGLISRVGTARRGYWEILKE